MNLAQHTVLQRAPRLSIEIDAVADVRLRFNGRRVRGNRFTLAVLDTFATPTRFQDALAALAPRISGPQAWIELTLHITDLHKKGILQEPGKQAPILRSHTGLFGGAPVHIRMLDDRARTLAYQEALRATVTPDDVVIDIGTGTGVMAVTAAKAGARHVYAIEASNIGRIARRVFEANGVADRITLVEGRSTQVTLPERGDVLVSEIIGNDPLEEGVLATTADAVQRLLKPEARLIPDRLGLHALPMSIPKSVRHLHVFNPQAVDRWRAWYEIDFTPALEASRRQAHAMQVNAYEAQNWQALTDPVCLADIDLKQIEFEDVAHQAQMPVTQDGMLNGILVYFDLGMGDGRTFSIHPDEATKANSWRSRVWLAGEPLPLSEGEILDLSYQFTEAGSAFKVTTLP